MPTFDTKKIIGFGVLSLLVASAIALYLSQKQTTMLVVPHESGVPASHDDLRVISVDHYFENGTHVYRGILTVPTPCHEILSQAIVMESYPEQVTIDLKEQSVSNFCVQVIAQTTFEVSFQASKEARVSANINGVPAVLKVTEKFSTKNTIPPIATTTQKFDDSFLYEGSAVE